MCYATIGAGSARELAGPALGCWLEWELRSHLAWQTNINDSLEQRGQIGKPIAQASIFPNPWGCYGTTYPWWPLFYIQGKEWGSGLWHSRLSLDTELHRSLGFDETRPKFLTEKFNKQSLLQGPQNNMFVGPEQSWDNYGFILLAPAIWVWSQVRPK